VSTLPSYFLDSQTTIAISPDSTTLCFCILTIYCRENLKMIRLQISSLETEKNDLKTAIMTGKTSKELLQSSSPFSTELERVEKKLKYAMKTLESKMLSLQMLEGNVNTIMGN